jgi:hypothetical protein
MHNKRQIQSINAFKGTQRTNVLPSGNSNLCLWSAGKSQAPPTDKLRYTWEAPKRAAPAF